MNSTKSRSNTLSYFLFRAGKNKVIWIILTVLNLMGFPLMFTSANLIYRANDDRFDDLMGAIAVIGVLSLIIAVIISLFVVYSAFDYLTNKVLSDMVYSTPITNNKRFLADWFSGLFTAVSPFVIGIAIGYIPAMFMRGKVVSAGEFGEIMSLYSQLAVAMIIALIMAYSIGAFVTMCCGAKLEAIGYSIMLHGLIPTSIFVTVFSAFRYFTNSSLAPVDDICLKLIAPTSPFGILTNLITSTSDNYYDDGLAVQTNVGYVKIFSFAFLFTTILIIVLLFGLTMFLNTKRKAEKCGNPFVFKGLYYTCMSLFVYCAVLISVANRDKAITIVLISMTCIVYMLFEVLKNRGFKRIWVGAVRLAVTLAVATALSFAVVAIGTMVNSRVPKVDEVQSVTIDYIVPSCRSDFISVEITDKETISKFLEIHQNKVDELNENTDEENVYDFGSGYYSYQIQENVVYKLNSGLTMKRCFGLSYYEAIELKDILSSQQYKQALINKLKKLSIPNGSCIMLSDFNRFGDTRTRIDASVFMQAYIKDLENINPKELQMPSKQPICDFSISSSDERRYDLYRFYPIYADFTNSIELIKSLGFADEMENVSVVKIDEAYLAETRIHILSPEIKDYTHIETYNEETGTWDMHYEYADMSVFTSMANLNFHAYDYAIYGKDTKLIVGVEYSDKVKELLKVAIPYGISDKPLYTIVIYDRNYLIPEEYSSLAREVMQSGTSLSEYEKQFGNIEYDYTKEELEEFINQ